MVEWDILLRMGKIFFVGDASQIANFSSALFGGLQLDWASTTCGRLAPSTCLPHKGGGMPLNALPKDTTSKLAGLFFTIITFVLSAKLVSSEYYFLKSFGMTRLGVNKQVVYFNHHLLMPKIGENYAHHFAFIFLDINVCLLVANFTFLTGFSLYVLFSVPNSASFATLSWIGITAYAFFRLSECLNPIFYNLASR